MCFAWSTQESRVRTYIVATTYPEAHCFQVRASPGQGLGCYATRDIEPGERLIAEAPLVSWASRPDAKTGHDWTKLQQTVDQLGDADLAKFHSLAQSDKYGHEMSAYGIWHTNAYPTPAGDGFAAPQDDVTRSAVFALCCRFNHACTPTAHIAWNSKLGKQTVHALRRIRSGQQIFVAYHGGDSIFTRDVRRAVLAKKYGFDCGCELCSLAGKALEMSERRQRRAAAIHEQLLSFPPSLPVLVEELLRILVEEGTPQVWATSPMFAALMHEQKRGDARAAAAWAQRGAECARLALGSGHRLHDKFEVLRVGLSKGGRPPATSPGSGAKAKKGDEGRRRGEDGRFVGREDRPRESASRSVDESGLLVRAEHPGKGALWLFTV